MKYAIEFGEMAIEDLDSLRAADRTRILNEIETQLADEPTVVTRNRKRLDNFTPSWQHVQPVWELRVGNWRVFYDVAEDEKIVTFRRIMFNGNKTTEELA